MTCDIIIGILISVFAVGCAFVVYGVAKVHTNTDIRAQCEQQGSIRLSTPQGDALFYCSREPKK